METTDVLAESAGTESGTGDVPTEVPWKMTDTGLGSETLAASEKLEPVPHESTLKLNTGEQRSMGSQGPDGGQLALAQPTTDGSDTNLPAGGSGLQPGRRARHRDSRGSGGKWSGHLRRNPKRRLDEDASDSKRGGVMQRLHQGLHTDCSKDY